MLTFDSTNTMLSLGFMNSILTICDALPIGVQTCLFARALSNDVFNLGRRVMKNALKIVGEIERTFDREAFLDNIVNLPCKQDILENLCLVLQLSTAAKVVVYCNSCQTAKMLQEMLSFRDFSCSCVYHKMDLVDKELVMRDFRLGLTRTLTTSKPLNHGTFIYEGALVINCNSSGERSL